MVLSCGAKILSYALLRAVCKVRDLNSLQDFQHSQSLLRGGRYQLVKQLEANGYWQTFLARDLQLPDRAECIVRQLKPLANSDQAFQNAKQRLETEATVLSQLRHQPCVPRLLAFETGPQPYLVCEHIEGDSIQAELAKSAPWSEQQVMEFLSDVLSTLVAVHQSDVVHGKLQPSTLIRRQADRRIVLTSFESATRSKSASAVTSASSRQPNLDLCADHSEYVPAEQAAGYPQLSSDVYAIGLIAIQALTGYRPSAFLPQAESKEGCWRPLASRRHPPLGALLDYLDHMVRSDFRDRYATAAEALSELKSLPSEPGRFIPSPELATYPHSTAALSRLKERDFPKTEFVQPLRQNSTVSKARPARPFQKLVLSASIGLTAFLGLGTLAWRALVSVPSIESVDAASSSLSSEQQALRSEEVEPNAFLPEPTPSGETAVKLEVPSEGLSLGATDQDSLPTEAIDETGDSRDVEGVLTSQTATVAVEDFYSHVASQSWDAARAMFDADLAKRFDSSFFEQFQQVSVENLRVTNQTAETVEIIGQNTYVYPDGSTQEEERAYTVQMINGWPSIIATSFIQVTKARQ